MGKQVNVYGLATVNVSFNKGSTWTLLGTTRDGVGITTDGYFTDVKNDEYGGEAGPPVEIQFLGETARVRCELTKYDPAILAALEDHCNSTNDAGVTAPAGTLLFAATSGSYSSSINVGAGGAMAVQISTPNGNRTYSLCQIHDAVEFGRGTKFSTAVVVFTAHKDPSVGGGTLYTDATPGYAATTEGGGTGGE